MPIIFTCTDCYDDFVVADNDAMEKIIKEIDSHVVNCPLAQFTPFCTTDAGARKLATILKNLRKASRAKGGGLH